jgi:hypothetical protein
MSSSDPLFRDLPLNHPCPNCGAKPRTPCGNQCHTPDDGGSYIIHCVVGDAWDTRKVNA